MARKKSLIDLEDDDLVLDRKAKRKLARSLEKKQQDKQKEEKKEEPGGVSGAVPSDAMSRVAMLCQEARWREALQLCRSVLNSSRSESNEDVACGILMAMEKIERSLRRQMASSLIVAANDVLKKEYLLNVGK